MSRKETCISKIENYTGRKMTWYNGLKKKTVINKNAIIMWRKSMSDFDLQCKDFVFTSNIDV